jgi:hypothetical protein
VRRAVLARLAAPSGQPAADHSPAICSLGWLPRSTPRSLDSCRAM